ncbi:YcnI family copper-binding membrane protein [Streptomyces sp. NBC_01497]|uniref:YcnI family copper-binding membrane protein n=1 Tax=Streptomyces sp. NBC_01497 TaxID=2903885 RepID=UPI002E37B7D1|nr:YcnI family protein [Streptomyces sp. NBC_01497]
MFPAEKFPPVTPMPAVTHESPVTPGVSARAGRSRTRTGLARLGVAGSVAAGAVLLLAGTASAHVTVQPHGDAVKGGSAVVDFKVPNERDNATTTKIEVDFPTDHPLASVMPEPVPGWKIDITKSKLAKPVELYGSQVTEAVSKVTWTAESGAGIPVGQFQLFPVSLSTLPKDADQVTFKALQTYSNKEIVRWIETQAPGAPEPEDPAPVLKLTAASAAEGTAAGQGSASGHPAAAASAKGSTAQAASAPGSSDTVARVLGIVGIVIGAAGVAYGLLVGRRRSA